MTGHGSPSTSLRRLIDEDRQNECECRDFLPHADYILLGEFMSVPIGHETEFSTHHGPSDYFAYGLVDTGGQTCPRICVWELKAPQCPMFVEGGANRLKPSPELIDAENKLLNHYCDLRSSEEFRSEFGLTDRSQVKLGGIIISRADKLVSNMESDVRQQQRFQRAHRIRDEFLYRKNNMRLLNWDHIAQALESRPIQGHTEEGRQTIRTIVPPQPISWTVQSSGDNS